MQLNGFYIFDRILNKKSCLEYSRQLFYQAIFNFNPLWLLAAASHCIYPIANRARSIMAGSNFPIIIVAVAGC